MGAGGDSTAAQLVHEIDDLLASRQGFVSQYRDWKIKATAQLREAYGERAAQEFERRGPHTVPINRQHRVHLYRQALDAQRRYLSQLDEAKDS